MEHQIQITKKSNSGLALQKLSRPSLAILNEDHPKIKTITNPAETDLLLNYLITILNLKASTKTEAKDLSIQMLVVMDFIKSKFGSLTIPEIQEAFKMYLAKEFPQIKVFRILDCVVVGEVLNAFQEFRNESLRVYDNKKASLLQSNFATTESEKKKIREKFLKYVFDELLKDGYSYDSWILYDELVESGKLITDNLEKKSLYDIELQKYIPLKAKEIFDNNPQARIFKRVKKDFQRFLDSKKPIPELVNKCKSILVSKYLSEYKNFDEFKNAIQL